MSDYKGFQFKTYDFSKQLDTHVDLIDLLHNTVGAELKKRPENVRWLFEPVQQYLDELGTLKENPDKLVYRHFTLRRRSSMPWTAFPMYPRH